MSVVHPVNHVYVSGFGYQCLASGGRRCEPVDDARLRLVCSECGAEWQPERAAGERGA